MEKTNKTYLTATEVSQRLNVSVKTLTGWYQWYNDKSIDKPENVPVLPSYRQTHERAPRQWNPDDIPQLLEFKEWVPKGRNGVMGRMNQKYWSKDKRTKSEED